MKRETSLSVAVDATQGKATPGPWTVQAPMIGMPERYIVVGDGFVVADCGLECPPIDGDGFSALANARLIAAAPALLSALQEVSTHARQYCGVPASATKLWERVRLVITQATEKESTP